MASEKQMEKSMHIRAQVEAMMRSYLGITQREIALALGVSVMCVNRHFNAIRRAWRTKRKAVSNHAGMPRSTTTPTAG